MALAIKLYEADYGHRPKELEDLLGKYIPSLPDNPLENPGTPIRYFPNGDNPRLDCLIVDLSEAEKSDEKYRKKVFFLDYEDIPFARLEKSKKRNKKIIRK